MRKSAINDKDSNFALKKQKGNKKIPVSNLRNSTNEGTTQEFDYSSRLGRIRGRWYHQTRVQLGVHLAIDSGTFVFTNKNIRNHL